jgi:Flp pilus assembly pilin Flp
MFKLAPRFANDQSGATAIEYGLIIAGIFLSLLFNAPFGPH